MAESGFPSSAIDMNTLELGTGTQASNEDPAKEIQEMLKQIWEAPGYGYHAHGYPMQAAFHSGEPSTSIYRRFGYLHSRVILELQDQLRELEEDLKNLDDRHAFSDDPTEKLRVSSRIADRDAAWQEYQAKRKRPPTVRSNGEASNNAAHVPDQDKDEQPSDTSIISDRAILLANIEDRLIRYDRILLKASQLNELQRPSNRDWSNMRFWYWITKPLSNVRETFFVQMKDDLITLKPKDETGKLDSWIDEIIIRLPERMVAFFIDNSPRGFPNPYWRYTHMDRIEKVAILVVVLIIIFLLATPVFIMYRITWKNTRSSTFLNIGLLIVFSLLFAASMGLLTKAKRAELFAATAAYCAVLIVFIGNFSSNAT